MIEVGRRIVTTCTSKHTSGTIEVIRRSPITLTQLLLVMGGLVPSTVGTNLLIHDEAPAVEQLVNVPMAVADLEPGTKITAVHLAISQRYHAKITSHRIEAQRRIVTARTR